MPDITMCKGYSCPMKDTCYRFTAKPNPNRQSYFSSVGYKIVKAKPVCEHYSPIEAVKKRKIKSK